MLNNLNVQAFSINLKCYIPRFRNRVDNLLLSMIKLGPKATIPINPKTTRVKWWILTERVYQHSK